MVSSGTHTFTCRKTPTRLYVPACALGVRVYVRGGGGVRAVPLNLVVPTGIQKKPKLKKEYIPYASL